MLKKLIVLVTIVLAGPCFGLAQDGFELNCTNWGSKCSDTLNTCVTGSNDAACERLSSGCLTCFRVESATPTLSGEDDPLIVTQGVPIVKPGRFAAFGLKAMDVVLTVNGARATVEALVKINTILAERPVTLTVARSIDGKAHVIVLTIPQR